MYSSHTHPLFKLLLLLSFFLIAWIGTCQAQVRVPFQPRASKADPTQTSFRVKGDFVIIGNTNLTLENYDDFKMNDNRMVYASSFVGGMSGDLNSSGAELKFPQQAGVDHACTEILFAGLYWTGRSGESRFVTITDQGATLTKDKQQISLQGPRLGDRLNVLVDANSIRFPEGLDNANDVGIFVGFQDVTDYVKFHGEGFYRGINLALLQGTNYYFGGWSLVVIYENPNLPLKDITVFDGYAYVRAQFPEEYTIQLEGIKTKEAGNVRVKLGVMAGEGDVAAAGDFLAIEKGAGSNDFVQLSHPLNSSDNFFNSSIYPSDFQRIPSLKNNTGMDLSSFYIDNLNNEVIANNQRSLKFKYGTTWDTYVIYNLTVAVDVDEPKIEGLHQLVSVNGSSTIPDSYKPGDEVTLQVDIRNLGTGQLRSNRLTINLPKGVELVSTQADNLQQPVNTSVTQVRNPDGSITLSWEMGNLDAVADIQEILARMRYKVRITEFCDELSGLCGAVLSLNGSLVGIVASTLQPYEETPLVIGKATDTPCDTRTAVIGSIDLRLDVFDFFVENCLNLNNGVAEICNLSDMTEVPLSELMKFFPTGTRFYDRNPLDPNVRELGENSGNPFPPTIGVDFFASFRSDQIGCFIPFRLANKPLAVSISVDEVCEVSGYGLREVSVTTTGLGVNGTMRLNGSAVTLAAIQRLAPGNYMLEVEDGGCLVEEAFTVAPFDVFQAVLDADESILEITCAGESSGQLTLVLSGGNVSFRKVDLSGFATDGTPLLRTIQNPVAGPQVFNNLPAGTYEWKVETVNGCTATGQEIIFDLGVPPTPADFTFTHAQIGQTGAFLPGQGIQFTITQPLQFTDVIWEFGDGQSSTLDNPVHTFQSPGTYQVSLSLLDSNGCIVEQRKEVVIIGGGLLMPDAFSPNGDGVNDYFFPVFTQVEKLTLRIYNRWGELIFYTADKNSLGWDGSHHGKPAPAASYSYQLEYTVEGEAQQIHRGTLVLVR